MKILVLGSNGFIGSNCVSYFRKKKNEIWSADINSSTTNKYQKLDKYDTNFIPLFKNQQYDVCINASGSANIAYSFNKPDNDFVLNVLNVQRLLSVIHKYNPDCRIINFSSAAVYGNPEKLPITETSQLNPISPYGHHKLQSESLLTEYHQFFGLRTCSLRLFSAYGPGLKKQIIWDIYQKYLQNKDVKLFGNGEESRDYIFIDDIIKAIEIVIYKGNFNGDSINIATGTETSIRHLATTFFSILDPNVKFKFTGDTKLGNPTNWCADIQKISDMNFKPKFTLTYGLTQVVSWIKDQKLV
jgi:UDP-glucose 4-epimerase